MKLFAFILFLMWAVPGISTDAQNDDFSIIVLPDTQYYTCEHWRLLDEQINWIVDNREEMNTVYVAHVGDIVDCGNTIYDVWFDKNGNVWRGCPHNIPSDCAGHRPIPGEPYPDDELREWKIVNDAFSKLEEPLPGFSDGIPYGLAIGNHDQSPPWTPFGNTTISYNLYFGVDRFAGRSYYGGSFEENNNDSHYDTFRAGGVDFIVIYIEHNRNIRQTDKSLNWADDLLETNSDKKAIIVFHHMINDPDDCDVYGQWQGPGQVVFNKLKHNTNLFMILCGHIGDGQSYRVDYPNGKQGNVVYTILSDYQARGTEIPDILGGGYLRIMEFSPSRNRFYVKSYSPFQDSWLTDCANEFELPFTTPDIHAVSPNGGEYCKFCSTQHIKWEYTAIADTELIRLVLLENDTPLGIIAENIQISTGSYTWSVGNYPGGTAVTGNNYKIRIETMDQTYSDDSDTNFSILNPTITVTSPNGDEHWPLGSPRTIKWIAADVTGLVSISIFKDDVEMGTVKGNLDPGGGSFTWTVGTLADETVVSSGSGYTIRIGSQYWEIEDHSDAPFHLFDSTDLISNGDKNQDLKKKNLVEK